MKHVHVMGIGGSGASAAAAVASNFGFKVSGCDMNASSEYVESLPKAITISPRHSLDHLVDVDYLVVSPAVLALDSANPELISARNQSISIMTWPEFVGKLLMQDKVVLAVCGTHGKSTTTALLGLMLEEAGLDPTVILGARVPKWKANYRCGKSKLFVIEADEYNNSFLNYLPKLVILTNLEYDHPEFFSSLSTMLESFSTFFGRIQNAGYLILDSSNEGTRQVLNLNSRLTNIFSVIDVSKESSEIAIDGIQLIGDFNAKNTAFSFLAASQFGVKREQAQAALREFKGIARRFELVGKVKNVLVYDDYAHHPGAIRETIKAVWNKFPGNDLWIVFQPHMYTRTQVLFQDFVTVFRESKYTKAIIVDIYSAREKDLGIVSSEKLVTAISDERVKYKSSLHEAADLVSSHVGRNATVICMGAGDISKASRLILANLESNG